MPRPGERRYNSGIHKGGIMHTSQLKRPILVFLVVGFLGCQFGCGSSATRGATATSVSSVSDLPDVRTMVRTSAASAPNLKDTVSGTPPFLKDITATNADAYFWNGLVAKINAASSVTSDQVDAFWEGEGACRMAQAVGYSFQNILQGATSLCYMSNAPVATSGVTVTSGSVTASEAMTQADATRIVKVQVTNFTEIGGSKGGSTTDQDIFIKIYGVSTAEGSVGYAADLWFCASGSPTSYENIRVNSSTGILTDTNVNKGEEGNFISSLSASLKSSGSKFVFDASKAKTADVYFTSDAFGSFFGNVSITDGSMTARNYQSGSYGGTSNTFKHSIFAEYSGDTMATLRFKTAGFALENTFGSQSNNVTGGTEFQGTTYSAVSSGTLYDLAKAEDFSAAVYQGSASSYATLLAAISNYDCSATPDVVVEMDFSKDGTKAVATQCENTFSDMDFCDDSTIQLARQNVFNAQIQSVGSCSTTFCSDDFSCQIYAENHPESGLTTANARCSNGCCAKQ